MASTGAGTQLLRSFRSKRIAPGYSESGYDIAVNMENLPMDSFSEEVRESRETIRKQYDTYQAFDSRSPGLVMKEFESCGEALSYVGLSQLRSSEYKTGGSPGSPSQNTRDERIPSP